MEDFEDIKAKVYLLQADDERNHSIFTSARLIIVRKGKKNVYTNDLLKKIEISQRRLLFPIIFGGIVVPFSFALLFSGLAGPYLILALLIAGIYLFYYGWIGSPVLHIIESQRSETIFLPSISQNVNAYVDYVNFQLQHLGQDFYLFFHENDKKEGKFFGYTPDQFRQYVELPGLPKTGYLHINPERLHQPVQFEYDATIKTMRPVILSMPNKEAIIDTTTSI
ncbi:MAG: hypothetical protein ACFCUU_06085 [Cyclobacteriaceae bacterium]